MSEDESMPRRPDPRASDIPILDLRALNRALLARQHLLERTAMPVAAMLEHLVGMQSQVPTDPFTGLWSRIERFDPADLDTLMVTRCAARVPLMRGTLHVVTARDAQRLRAVVQPLYDTYGAKLVAALPGLDLAALHAVANAAMATRPCTRKDLESLVAERFPAHPPASIAAYLQYALPLLQVPPSGTWAGPHRPAWTTLAHWLGDGPDERADVDGTIRRYLTAFGPATVADIAAWSKLTGIRPHIERMRSTLRTFRNERGQELFDVPDGLLPDPETPAPVRFLPEFDNLLLSHTDRTRVIDDHRRNAIGEGRNGRFLKTWTLDGFVHGAWKPVLGRREASIRLTPFASLTSVETELVAGEAARLLAFLAPDTTQRTIAFS